jgi:hypothetical protein
MVKERNEFKPSLIGRVLDATINAPPLWPADIMLGLLKAEGPYKKVLGGKITDPEKVTKAIQDYNLWHGRLYGWIHRNDQP